MKNKLNISNKRITYIMFPQLPEEIERMIWKAYYERNIIDDIQSQDCIWSRKNVKRLLSLCRNDRCYQENYSDIERMRNARTPRLGFIIMTRYRVLSQYTRHF